MVTNSFPPCMWAAALLIAGSTCGCGAPAMPARRADSPAPSAAAAPEPRQWVFVRAPSWSSEVTSVSTQDPSADYCITSASARACVRDGTWTDVAWGGPDSLWLSGRSGDSWVFDDREGHVFVSRGFTGALRELAQAAATRAVGRPWHTPARLTVDGTLLEWSGSEFTPVRLPGRVYDAAFSSLGLGVVLAEPGVVYLRDAGQPWTPAVQPSLAPSAIRFLDRATLPDPFGAVVDEQHWPGLDREFRDVVEGAWLTEQVRRFGQHRGATLPDLVPSLLYQLEHRGIIAPPSSMSIYMARPLTHGWLALGDHAGAAALLLVSPDLTTQLLVEGSEGAVLSSHDGRETLALGRGCGPDDAQDEKGRRACFTDGSGPHTVQLPPGIACAEVVALGSGQLLVGGYGCPTEVCGDHLLVRFDLRQPGGQLEPIAVSVEGDVPPGPRVDADECDMEVNPASDIIPDGASVLGTVRTEDGERLLSGPLFGPLRALPLPAEGDTAFADAQHGVLLDDGRAWTTSNGGETWEPVSTPMHGGDLCCSAEACRLGDLYWLPPSVATRLGLERASPTAETPVQASASPRPNWFRRRLAAPPRATLTPSNTLIALRQSPPSLGRSWVVPVVGGFVETNFHGPNHTGDVAWRGVTPEGTPFHVVTTATNPLGGSAPWKVDEYEVLAMTERFAALVVQSSGTAFQDIWIIRRDGGSSRHPTQLPRTDRDIWDRSRWPLPLPDGGLGLYVFVGGLRWLVRLSRDGEVMAQRALQGLPYRLDELLAWHDGELGLAIRAGEGLARLYVIDGTEREIALPQTPEGLCQAAAIVGTNLFASQWGARRATLESAPSADVEWVLSEEHGGRACMRAMVPRWRTVGHEDVADGSELVMVVGGALRGWFISTAGTVEWSATFPGVAAPRVEPDHARDGLTAWSLELTAVRTGLQLWAPVPVGSRSRISTLAWDGQRFTTAAPDGLREDGRRFQAGRGILLNRHAAFPLHGGVAQPRRQPPESGEFVDGVHNERGTTLVTRHTPRGERVDWPGERGEALHSYLEGEATGDEDWRWPLVTHDGRTVVMLTNRRTRGVATLQAHRLRSDGTITAGSAMELDEEDFGRITQLRVASAGQAVVAAVGGLRGRPLHVYRASGTRAFRLLGHPIGTTRCGAAILAVAAAPPRIVWTDCAIGTERRFVRFAQLAGNRWHEVVDAHPLPPRAQRVAAAIDPTHGAYVVYLEDREAVLVKPRGNAWDEVTRYSTPSFQP